MARHFESKLSEIVDSIGIDEFSAEVPFVVALCFFSSNEMTE